MSRRSPALMMITALAPIVGCVPAGDADTPREGAESAASVGERVAPPSTEEGAELTPERTAQAGSVPQRNLALEGAARQSSLGFGGRAERANDGNTNGRFQGGSVSHTARGDARPWWEVELRGPSRLSQIVIWNRTDPRGDRLTDFEVTILDATRRELQRTRHFGEGSYPSPSYEVPLPEPVEGAEFVRVTLDGDEEVGVFLSLAEVEVVGWYDPPLPAVSEAPSNAPEARVGPDLMDAEARDEGAVVGAIPQPRDSLVVPGERFGPLTAGSSQADLLEAYGEGARATAIPIGEGMTRPGTTLFDGAALIEILWHTANRRCPEFIIVRTPNAIWKTVDGIGSGSTLKEVEAANGGPFTFLGFEWDQQGYVADWLGGRLEGLRLRLAGGSSMLTREEYSTLMGDHQIRSDFPTAQKLDPVVTEMGMGWLRQSAESGACMAGR